PQAPPSATRKSRLRKSLSQPARLVSHVNPESPIPPAEPRTIIVVAPRQTVHWVIAGLLAILATLLALRGGDGLLGGSPAMAQTGMLGARGLFAFTGQIDKDKFGLWMMDVDAGTV